MISRRLARQFSVYNPLRSLKQFFTAPKKHLKMAVEPDGLDKSSWGNQTEEAYDEVSQEWQAAIMQNTYDVNTMQYLDATIQPNYGTVDNPHIIVTSDAPFRYVGCSGQPNEDDYEGHEFLVFMLREGPLQRCPQCGQVYKLVRLRDEYSSEMDYYSSSTMPMDIEEMGEADHFSQMTPLRLMPNQWEHTVFEQPSNIGFSLINPDDHDRMIVDPAYRLEKLQQAENVGNAVVTSMRILDDTYLHENPSDRKPMSMTDYENLHEAEVSIARLDRIFNKASRFASRQFLDLENHERREKRMRENAHLRTRDSYSVYFGGMTEEEAKYKDYFETDLEANPDNEMLEEWETEQRVASQDHMRLEKWDFQETYTHNPEEAVQSSLQKAMFEFKYRRAKDTQEEFMRRETRLMDRSLGRMNAAEVKDLFNKLAEARKSDNQTAIVYAQGNVYSMLAEEGRSQFKDYYESDSENVSHLVDHLPEGSMVDFLGLYTDYARGPSEIKGVHSIPKRRWNHALGLWGNVTKEIFEFDNNQSKCVVGPEMVQLRNQLNDFDAQVYTRDLLEGQSSSHENKAKELPEDHE